MSYRKITKCEVFSSTIFFWLFIFCNFCNAQFGPSQYILPGQPGYTMLMAPGVSLIVNPDGSTGYNPYFYEYWNNTSSPFSLGGGVYGSGSLYGGLGGLYGLGGMYGLGSYNPTMLFPGGVSLMLYPDSSIGYNPYYYEYWNNMSSPFGLGGGYGGLGGLLW